MNERKHSLMLLSV